MSLMLRKRIVLEGIDGAGKQTQAGRLSSFLRERGEVDSYSYPDTGKPIGSLIGRFLRGDMELPPESQVLLFAADMAKDREAVREAGGKGRAVLMKRYVTSMLAYQVAQGLLEEKAMAIIKGLDFPRADLIFYLRISPSTSVRRKINQKNVLDRFESKEAFQARIAKIYDSLAESGVMGKWVVVDGEKSQEEVFEQITKHL